MSEKTESHASRPERAHPVRPQIPNSGARTGARMPLVLTSSRVGCFLACPRRHLWAYELGIRPERDGVALSIGSAYHKALERLNRGDSIEKALESIAAFGMEPLDAALAACMASGWQWRWSNHPIGRIVECERVFQFRSTRGARFTVAGKIDAIAVLPDGRTAVIEYKTTREDISPASDYWRRLSIDRQVSWYILGARSLGYDVDTVVYDAARVPGLKPKLLSRKKDAGDARESIEQFADRLTQDISERPDWYFARQEIPRIQADLDEARAEMSHFAGMIGSARAADRHPRNTDACKRWGKCPYFGPCADGHDPIAQGVPPGFRVVPDVNVELTVCMENERDSSDDASAE